MIQTILRKAALAAIVSLGMAGVAQATTVSTCDILNFTTSTQCVSPVTGGPGGNVTVDQMNAGTGLFGSKGWGLIASIGSTNSSSGSQQSSGTPFSFLVTYDNNGKQSGTWSLNPLLTWGSGLYAFAIKGSNDNAVYLMDTDFTNGKWNVLDLNNGGNNDPDLSNIRLFGTTALVDAPPTPQVPLPAGLPLLLAGLGALALVRRRKA